MDAARQGIITKEMELVAKKERMTPEEVRAYVAKGQIAIPCNKNHTCIDPNGIGSMLKTKINVNLGTSRVINYAHRNNIAVQYWTINDPQEMERLQSIGADAIMTDVPDQAGVLVQP